MVSRRHARIAYEDEDWWLTVEGRNGLKADGSSIAMNEKITLANGYSPLLFVGSNGVGRFLKLAGFK
jgi:predicted component of type VI protein secretion system